MSITMDCLCRSGIIGGVTGGADFQVCHCLNILLILQVEKLPHIHQLGLPLHSFQAHTTCSNSAACTTHALDCSLLRLASMHMRLSNQPCCPATHQENACHLAAASMVIAISTELSSVPYCLQRRFLPDVYRANFLEPGTSGNYCK